MRANGIVRGEGGGVVVLKPLSAALRDGDHVYCVIRGSAVNNDGPTDGLTTPGGQAQEKVLASACRRAGVNPAAVQSGGRPRGPPRPSTGRPSARCIAPCSGRARAGRWRCSEPAPPPYGPRSTPVSASVRDHGSSG
ncbi:MAG: hypothetical protein ACRDP6_02120 [Actinoallomurus sp.]